MIFPEAQRVNRGNYVVKQLVEACRSHGYSDLVIVHEHRGEPGTSLHLACRRLTRAQMAWSSLIFRSVRQHILALLTLLCATIFPMRRGPPRRSRILFLSALLVELV